MGLLGERYVKGELMNEFAVKDKKGGASFLLSILIFCFRRYLLVNTGFTYASIITLSKSPTKLGDNKPRQRMCTISPILLGRGGSYSAIYGSTLSLALILETR